MKQKYEIHGFQIFRNDEILFHFHPWSFMWVLCFILGCIRCYVPWFFFTIFTIVDHDFFFQFLVGGVAVIVLSVFQTIVLVLVLVLLIKKRTEAIQSYVDMRIFITNRSSHNRDSRWNVVKILGTNILQDVIWIA